MSEAAGATSGDFSRAMAATEMECVVCADGSVAAAGADVLPPGVLVARVGAGANCSSAGSAIDILFYTSVIAGAIAVALSAAFPPRGGEASGGDGEAPPPGPPSGEDAREEMR